MLTRASRVAHHLGSAFMEAGSYRENIANRTATRRVVVTMTRLLGGATDMGGEDDVRQTLQFVDERVPCCARLTGVDIQAGSGDVP